jgi:hypothetical protein
MARAVIATHAGSGQGEQRANALPTGGDQMGGELRDECNITFHPRNDGAVAKLQIVGNEAHQTRQRILV